MITTFLTNQVLSVKHLQDIISSLTFLNSDLGDEIENFNLNEPTTIKAIENELGYKVKIKDNSGCIRKPYPFVHFESFDTIDEWVICAPIQPTTFITHKHLETEATYVFHMQDVSLHIADYADKAKWIETSRILVESGQLLFFRPWIWHSFDGGLNNMISTERAE